MRPEITPAVATHPHPSFRVTTTLSRWGLTGLGAVALFVDSPGAEREDFDSVLDAFSGEWAGEVEVRAPDGALLKTFPIERTYRWEDSLQVVETRMMQDDDEYRIQALQSVRLGRLYSLVSRPAAAQDEFVGTIQGGGIDWQNTARNDRDFTEKIMIERGAPKLEFSSLEALRFAGITGVVRLHAELRPKDGRLQLGSVSRAEVEALRARVGELEAALAQTESAPAPAPHPPAGPEAETETEEWRAAVAAAETQADQLSGRIRELEREREELRGKLAETAMLNWTTEALQKARAEADQEFVRLRNNLAESRQQAAAAQREATAAQTELESIRVELTGARAESDAAASIAEWRRRFDAAIAERDEAVARSEEGTARVDALERETEELRTQAADAAALIDQTRQQLQAAEVARAAQRAELETAQNGAQQVADLQSRLADAEDVRRARDAAENQVTKLQDELTAMRAQVDQTRSGTGELNARIAALDEAVGQANAGWEAEQEKTQELSTQLREAVARADSLEAQVASADMAEEQQKQQGALRSEITQLGEQLKATESERDDFAVKLANAQAESIRLSGQIEQLEAAAQAADARHADASGNLAALEQETAALRKQLEEAKSRIETVQIERDQLIRASDQASAELERINAVNEQLATAKQEADALRGRVGELEANLATSAQAAAELERERDALLARMEALEARPVVPASESERARREADQQLARLEQERQTAIKELGEVQARLKTAEAANTTADSRLAELESELRQLRDTSSTELAQARARATEFESSSRDLAGRLEKAAAERDTARQQAAGLAEAERELSAAKAELETQQSIAGQRQSDNENLVRRNERLAQERDELAGRLAAAEKLAKASTTPPAPAQGVAADGSVSQKLLDRVDQLDRRVIELESERNALTASSRLLESQLAEARALRDDTLARFQDVVSQLNAMREERDRLARANVALQSDLRAARQPAREIVQAETSAPAEAEGNVFSRIISAIGGDDVPRTADTVIASFEVIGITHTETEDKVILNGRLYRNGDTVDSELGLVFQRIDGDALVFADRRGREYRRRF